MQDITKLTDGQYRLLKQLYNEAISRKMEQFPMGEQTVLTKFAKYWIEAVENERKRTGKKIIENRQSHDCPDGTTYEWISKKEKPVSCPRCKQYLSRRVRA